MVNSEDNASTAATSSAAPSERERGYRYRVDLLGAEITPLASVHAFWGQDKIRVQNISRGGVALIFDRDPPAKEGDISSLSIELRDHAFPVQVEIRAIRGLKIHCAFIEPSKTFDAALKEFLKPKFLGERLARHAALSNRPDVLVMVPDAHNYEAFVGPSETAVFVWTNREREVLRFVGVTGEFIMEWRIEEGLNDQSRHVRTGQRPAGAESDTASEPNWHRAPEGALLNHFADIFLAWLKFEGSHHFVDRLIRVEDSDKHPLVFPIV